MILLRDEIEIEASPEQAFDWLAHFKDNYLTWHPAHVECRYLKGASLKVGSIIYIEEYLHGEVHKLKFQVTDVITNSRVDYKAGFGMGGSFKVEPQGNNVLFIAEVTVGFRFPVLGWLVDRLMRALFSDRLEALKQHMTEEGKNLKQLLET